MRASVQSPLTWTCQSQSHSTSCGSESTVQWYYNFRRTHLRFLVMAFDGPPKESVIGLTCEHRIFRAKELDPARTWVFLLVDALPSLILHVHCDLLALLTRLSFVRGKVRCNNKRPSFSRISRVTLRQPSSRVSVVF